MLNYLDVGKANPTFVNMTVSGKKINNRNESHIKTKKTFILSYHFISKCLQEDRS